MALDINFSSRNMGVVPPGVQKAAREKWEKILRRVQQRKPFRGKELAWGIAPWLFGHYVLDQENGYLSYCRVFLQPGEDEENVCEMCPLNMTHCQWYKEIAPQSTLWRFVAEMQKAEPDWPRAEQLAKAMLSRISDLGCA